jgi:hypothetical protein
VPEAAPRRGLGPAAGRVPEAAPRRGLGPAGPVPEAAPRRGPGPAAGRVPGAAPPPGPGPPARPVLAAGLVSAAAVRPGAVARRPAAAF